MHRGFDDDPILGPAYAYWRDKCGVRPMPRRRDIDPTEIPQLLPHLLITELVDGGARLRYRLAGTAVVAAYGGELTGKNCDEVCPPERRASILANYRLICERRRPLLLRHRYLSSRGAPLVCHRLVMPLSDDGDAVTQFVAALRFEFTGKAHEWTGHWADAAGDFTFDRGYSTIVA
ncbi:MAG: PAS domain-containing protein [Alphaproteobacteria bacterium]|nr:PAS domain-containing protein [Alphaproteobacteria bacterium]